MVIYVTIFITSSLMVWVSELFWRQERRFFSALVLLFAALLCATVAGVRDISIGSDTHGYVLREWLVAGVVGAPEEMGLYSTQEKWYLSLVWLLRQLSSDIHVLLFTCSLIQTVAVLFALRVYGDGHGEWCGFLFYLLFHYCESLNAIRQGMAIGLCLLAFALYYRKHRISALIALVIAVQFHRTAMVTILVLPFVDILNYTLAHRYKDIASYPIVHYFTMLLLLIVPIFLSQQIESATNILTDLGVLVRDYSETINMGGNLTGRRIYVYIAILVFMIIKNDEIEHGGELAYIYYFGLSLVVGSLGSKFLFRIGLYFLATGSLYMVELAKETSAYSIHTHELTIYIIKLVAILTLAFVFWFIREGVNNYNQTVPYRSDILTVLNI